MNKDGIIKHKMSLHLIQSKLFF